MRKILVFIFLSVFLCSLVSAATCNPDSGYDRCFWYDNSHSYGNCRAYAYVKVQGTSQIQVENGRKIGEYVTGPAYIKY